MRRILLMIATAAMAILPTAVNAQKNIERAMKNFESNVERNGIWRKYTQNNFSDGVSYYYENDFAIPKKNATRLDALKKAFYEDTYAAYDLYIRKAGYKENYRTLPVGYGDNAAHTVYFGANTDHNYLVMLVRDPVDSLYRYCYGIVWYEKKGEVRGSIHRIYGIDPKKRKKTNTKLTDGRRTVKLGDGVIVNGRKLSKSEKEELEEQLSEGNYGIKGGFMNNFAESMQNLGKTIKDNMTSYVEALSIVDSLENDGNPIIVRNNGKTYVAPGPSAMSRSNDGTLIIKKQGKTVLVSPEGTVTVTRDKGGKTRTYTPDNNGGYIINESEPDAIGIIQKFGNLRAAYLTSIREQADITVLTGLANSICSLMKEGASKLSEAEKKLCENGIHEMQGKSLDSYISGLLGLAEDYLRK